MLLKGGKARAYRYCAGNEEAGSRGTPARWASFRSRHHFASYNGTAPTDSSSGGPGAPRVNTKGNRKLNHAIHIAAICQIRAARSAGHAYYRRKLAEGKTENEAIRALKRRISDAIYRHLVEDAEAMWGPGGQPGTTPKLLWNGLSTMRAKHLSGRGEASAACRFVQIEQTMADDAAVRRLLHHNAWPDDRRWPRTRRSTTRRGGVDRLTATLLYADRNTHVGFPRDGAPD